MPPAPLDIMALYKCCC